MRLMIIALLFMVANIAQAASIKAELVGDRLRWDNAMAEGADRLLPSGWDIVKGLPPTKSWLPGGLSNASPTSVKLTYGNQQVNLPIKVVGFEYHVGSIGDSAAAGSNNSSAVCSEQRFTKPIIRVGGAINCRFSHFINTAVAYSPYSFIRPILEVKNSDIVNAFNGKPEGRYLGTLSVGSAYDFYYDNGVLSRFYQNNLVNVEIVNSPNYLTSVQIQGNRVLAPTYLGDQISAETVLTGEVSGRFSNGVKVSLRQNVNDYFLRGPTGMTIPYSIKCNECIPFSLVENGAVRNRRTKLNGNNVNSITFHLTVSYKDIPYRDLDTGYYQDSIVLIFEPDV